MYPVCLLFVPGWMDIIVMQSSDYKKMAHHTTAYTYLTISSPNCTLHVAIAHMTTALANTGVSHNGC